MANTIINIFPSGSTIVSDVKNALNAKYGAGITFHYQTTTDLIFTCPAINSKVIRFYCDSGMVLRFYYADAWVSTTTLTNSVMIASSYYSGYSTWFSITMALGDEFILLNALTASSDTYSMLVVIAKTTDVQDVAISGVGSKATSAVYSTFRSKLIATNEDICLGGFQSAFLGPTNVLYKVPLYIIKNTNNQLLADGNGAPVSINGLSACTYPSSSRTYNEKLPNQFITTSMMYDYLGLTTVCNPLLVEY